MSPTTIKALYFYLLRYHYRMKLSQLAAILSGGGEYFHNRNDVHPSKHKIIVQRRTNVFDVGPTNIVKMLYKCFISSMTEHLDMIWHIQCGAAVAPSSLGLLLPHWKVVAQIYKVAIIIINNNWPIRLN